MLTLVATPIGNLGDISFRAVEAIRAADAVYCEDTRRTVQLLNHLDIKKRLVSCHEHNERSRAQEIVELLRNGGEVVYVSDAGMPGISDPGAVLVSACIEAGLPYTVIPGASAVLTAAVLSGFPCGSFSFYGFLPRDNKTRNEVIGKVRTCGHLAILYESPHRVGNTFRDLSGELGNCRAALLRELTKKYETVVRGTVNELAERFREEEPKGECVIAVYCADALQTAETGADADEIIRRALREGLSAKEAAAAASAETGMRRNAAYARALEISRTEQETGI